jgi:hypothetical protein
MFYPRENVSVFLNNLPLGRYYADTPSDISNLPGVNEVAPGSDVYCISTQDVYILNSSGNWEVQ